MRRVRKIFSVQWTTAIAKLDKYWIYLCYLLKAHEHNKVIGLAGKERARRKTIDEMYGFKHFPKLIVWIIAYFDAQRSYFILG